MQELSAFFRQLRVLIARNFQLIFNNKLVLASLLLQAPLMVGVIALVGDPDCFTSNLIDVGSRTVLFILAAVSSFMGLLNSYREICKEREIIFREASVGVSLGATVLAKMVTLALISLVQAAILTAGFVRVIHVPQNDLLLDTDFELYITVLLILLSSASMGLLVSAAFKNSESAILFVLVLIIAQVVFSGALFPVSGAMTAIGYLVTCRWGDGGVWRLHRPQQPAGLAQCRAGQPHVQRHGAKPYTLLADARPAQRRLPHRRLACAQNRICAAERMRFFKAKQPRPYRQGLLCSRQFVSCLRQ